MAEIKIQGLSQLQKRLSKLSEKVERKVYRQAMQAAAVPVQEEASSKARRSSEPSHPKVGHLANNIEVTVRKQKEGYTATVHTGRAFWGTYLEFGTQKMRKYPFMRPAFDAKAREMVDTLAKELGEGIEREA